MIQSRETWCVNTTKDSNIFQMTFGWVRLAKMLGFTRKVSREQCIVTIHDIWLAGLGRVGSCRENTALQDEERSQPKGWIRGNTEVGPVLEVKVTHHSYHIGIDIKIDSMKNDGSQFWTVISRGMNKYVTKLPEENGTSTHGEEVVASTAKPVATKQKEQFTP